MIKHKNFLLMSATLLLGAAVLTLPRWNTLTASPKTASTNPYLINIQTGNPKLQAIGKISFGPQGLLLVAEPGAASLVAIQTGDVGPVVKLKQRIDDIDGLIASGLGTQPGTVKILGLAVNPASGKIYLSVLRQADKQTALLVVDASGHLNAMAMDNLSYVRISLPTAENAQFKNITDLAFAGDRVVVAGQSSEEFANKIYSLPLPLTHGIAANVCSAETYHVSHKRWETKAPIQSFIPYEENGKHYIVGAFACTPIAKFPLDGIQFGSKIQGVSVVELGSGNRPVGMIAYHKDGKKWVVTNTQRMQKNLFGPSKYWGARVDMNYLTASSADKINENAIQRNVKENKGPEGIEVVDALFGAMQISQLDNDEIVVLRENGEKQALEMARLP